MAIKHISVEVHGTCSDSVTNSVRCGHTGRVVLGAEAYILAAEWADSSHPGNHPAQTEFCQLLASAPRLSGPPFPCFRGRGFDVAPPPPLDFGPPPVTMAKDGGRYDQTHDHFLYLSDSEDGVRRELSAWLLKGVPYVQQFQIPVDELTIADFSQMPEDHLFAAVFARTEECKVPGRGPDNYKFSQHIAALVHGFFDGMRVLGVHGEPSGHYTNVVIFEPQPHWVHWLAPGMLPHRLDT